MTPGWDTSVECAVCGSASCTDGCCAACTATGGCTHTHTPQTADEASDAEDNGIDGCTCRSMFGVYHGPSCALSDSPNEKRPTHGVHRREDWTPCWCNATGDHPIGSEVNGLDRR